MNKEADLELKQIFDQLSKNPSYNIIFSDDGNTLIKASPLNIWNTKNLILKNILHIDDYAFSENKLLCSIILPKGLQTIGNYAFYNCSKLSSINIPDSVNFIGQMAFHGCCNNLIIEK